MNGMRTIPDVPIELDRVRNLRLTTQSQALAERAFARFWNQGLPKSEQREFSFIEVAATGTAASVAAVLWGGLVHEDPSLTFDLTFALIDKATSGGKMGAVNEAIRTAL